MDKNHTIIEHAYQKAVQRIEAARAAGSKPLTYTEKILLSHASQPLNLQEVVRGETYVDFAPDRVAMQDATAQMALLQFMQAGRERVAVPSSVHCDHLINASKGAANDLQEAGITNAEVYNFLGSVSAKYGIEFWKPGAGIIHQIVLENYAFPGGMMIGTDSHTVNAGGLGMLAIGVGGADAVDVMAGMPWELKLPRLIGVKLSGSLSGWTAAKDIILKLAGILTVNGGTGCVVEYFGDGARNLSCTGKATICNMGAEIGATNSLFPYDEKMSSYLNATGRGEIAAAADRMAANLCADEEVYADPEKYYDQVVEIDLDQLEPYVNGPFTPDLATPISELKNAVEQNGWPLKIEAALIGSCTNSSYEDIARSASIIRNAQAEGVKLATEFYITPGSEQVKETIERDGFAATFTEAGGTMLANACGPCIGQWKRPGAEQKLSNTIMISYNRNFAKRNDGNPNTHSFVVSPEIATAFALAGRMDFNPLTDTLTGTDGKQVKLQIPQGDELPPAGFLSSDNGLTLPPENGDMIEIDINPDSDRLQLLTPFSPWDGSDISDLKLLIKARGKCTTDHISMAGPWLKYRGHLDNISGNMLIGATNSFNSEIDSIRNMITGEYDSVPAVARAYKEAGIGSIIVGDENYGEGSSREHAAMEPRFLNVKVVLVRSFARIHETNLKKQGILAVSFNDPTDYDRILEDDTLSVQGLADFAPGKLLSLLLTHSDGSEESVTLQHTYSENQIKWFKAGSALNHIRNINK
jgi:aconitate hydratase